MNVSTFYHIEICTWPRPPSPPAGTTCLRVTNYWTICLVHRNFFLHLFSTCFCLDHSGRTHVFFGLQQGPPLTCADLSIVLQQGYLFKGKLTIGPLFSTAVLAYPGCVTLIYSYMRQCAVLHVS